MGGGFDVDKTFHWVCALDDDGATVLSKRVGADERELESCASTKSRPWARSARWQSTCWAVRRRCWRRCC